ncbi:MAG: ABC transporter ATP-binding protein [Candidatus Bathyarchaeia archaeon]
MGQPLLEVKDLTKYYTSGYIFTKKVLGCEKVSFNVNEGEIFTLVGESGSGKTTVAKLVMRLIKPTSGSIYLDGKDIYLYDQKEYYTKVQAIFQDPFSSFNPRYSVERVFDDVFKFLLKGSNLSKEERQNLIVSALEKVRLSPEQVFGRFTYELSGGQMQRILIARALLIKPRLIVADEITSMIDASTRVDVLNELLHLKEREKMAVLFITHDIGQAYYVSDRVAVMWKGKIVEEGPAEKVLFDPETEYTRSLVKSVPKLHEKWEI